MTDKDFFSELARIMGDDEVPPVPVELAGPPHSFGWMRRSELDRHFLQAWEDPTGLVRFVRQRSDARERVGRR